MKQKTKHLQLSGETRKTNRTWHFLSTLNSLLLSKLLLLLIIPVMGTANAWSQSPTLATKDYGTTSHKYLDVANSTSNAQINNGANCVTFGGVYLNSIVSSVEWFSTTANCSNSNVTISSYNYAANGFLTYAGNSTPSYTQAYGQYNNVSSSVKVYFWVTGTTSVAIIGQGNGSSNYIVLHIDEVGADGTTLTEVGTDVSQNNTAAVIAHASTLDATKYYKVTVTADNTSNNKLGQIRFTKPTAPATPYTVNYRAGEGGTCATSSDTYTGSPLTLPSVSPNSSAGNYQNVFNGWYTASNGGTRVGGAGDSYTPSDDTELFAQYSTKYYIATSVAPAGAGAEATIVASGTPISNGSYVLKGTVITVTAGAASSGYAWNRWSNGTNNSSTSFDYTVAAKKTFIANYTTNTAITPSSAAYTVGDTPSSITYAPTLSPAGDGATYQWYKNSANSAVVDNEHKIDGATSATLAAAKIDTGSEGTTYYYCVVTPTYSEGSKSGTSATSNIVTVTVSAAVATTYSVTYNANLTGTTGSVPTDGTAYAEGATVTVKGNTGSLAKDGYTFLGWSTTSGYSSTYKTAGETITMGTADVNLYAQWKIDSSLESSSPSSGTVVTDGSISTTASSPATGMYLAQAGSAYDAATLKTTTLRGTSFTSTLNSSDAGNTQVLSILLTDGTFYSDVITHSYTVGVATPVISCSGNTVTITCATDGAEIRYTDDGTEPTTSTGTVYSGSFAITATKTIKAIAIKNETNSAVASQDCVYATSITDLPVTIDFGASPFSTSTDFSGASGKTMSLTQNSHEVYFHGSNQTEFSIVSGSPNALRMNSNGATNHFIAIPMSNINGRIDIEVWAPYTDESNFTIRAVLDTGHGTTVQSAAPSAIKTAALDVNDYSDGHFYFRMKDITATNGVLYIGPASSSYKDYQKIRVTSPAHYLIPDKASVTMGDGSEPETVTITNYSAYPVLLKTVPSYVTATFEPSTGVLVITPKAIGTGGAIELAVDTNGDGEASDVDLSIPVTVTGITNVTAPTSAVYDTSSGSYSPALDALSVTATKSATGNTGTLAYQWYSNTVNSNTGGTVISGATSNTLSTDKISTTDSEKAAFYYCVVSLPGDSCKSVASDVAYVLTSKSKRYFHMSNVAGNRQTSDASEKITGEIVAGGTATAIHGAGSYYRYITRPSSSYAHMYVVSNANNYIKINLKNAIATDDVISVLQMGNQGTSAGIKIATDASGSNAIEIYQDGTDTKTYSATFTAAFNGVKEIYILGKYEGHQNYFTDLYISKPAPLAVSAPTPASQIVQSGETPAAFTVTATGGTGSYTYAWKQDTDPSGSFNDDAEGTVVSDGGTSTFTPTSKSVADNTTYYYKCIVTSGGSNETTGAATLTVTTLTHGYMTIDGRAHAGQTYSFDKNEFKYFVNQSNYNSQNVTITDGQNQKFWELDSSPKWATKDPYTNAADIKAGSNAKFVNLYIKDAVAFKVLALNSASRTYDIYVDGKKVATSQSANPSIESPIFALNKGGSKIEFNNAKEGDSDTDVQIAYIIFYEKAPATINVLKNGEEVTEATQYMGDGATEYEVETNGDGILSLVKPTGATDVTNGYRTTYAEVTLNNGILRVTPLAATPTTPTSTPETITINHTSGTSYADASTTLDVTVKKHTLALAFSYEKASFKASTLTESTVIPSGSLPTLTATVDGEVVDLGTLDIRYKTDDRTIGYFGDTDTPASSRSADGTSYAVKYGGGQGGARIYAYVDNRENPNYSSAKAYFDFVVEAGTSNAIPKSISIDEQQVFKLANSSGVEVVKLTYGGYKYNHEGGWRNSASRGKYYIDGYQYYTRHGMDALDEYGYQLRGMSDEAQAAPSGSESGDKITVTKKKAKKDGSSSVTFDVYKYSSQNVGAHTFWYTEAETRPDGQHYLPYQRIRPFTLPTRGGYLKFEPKQTGKLTVYVWQNGQMEAKDSSNPDRVGSKPRLGYWFDQNGWVQKPVVAPITKQPITSESFASDVWAGGVRTKMENIWTTTDDIPAINMLTYQYCDNAENPTAYYAESGTGHTDLNPYFWKTRAQVRNNLNEETTIISEKMTPAPYHNGYLVPEESYLKYVINVVAGKSYYFYGMMTKIGYVGMNFVEDDNVTISDTGKKFYHETNTLHLKADDNMEDIVTNSVHGDGTTYLGSVYDEVTLPSNYKKGQWSTICLPFSLTEEQVEEAFGVGTQLTIYNGAIKKSEGIFSVKYLSHVDRNILAGQPYFIKPSGVDANGGDLENVEGVIGSAVEGASGTRITFNTVCIDSNFSTTTTYGSDKDVNESGEDIHQEGYKFVGAYNNKTLPTYSYIVSKGELRRFTGSTSKIPTYYAYLKPNTTKAQQGGFSMDVPFTDSTVETAWVINGDDDTTDVISMEAIADAMNNGKVITNGKAYNMMGQEIDPTSAKGIVIINGKKYMFE